MSVTLAVGIAVAKLALKAWLRDQELARDASLSLIQIIEARVPDALLRRKAQRSFDRLADTVAERLEPFVDAELRGLEANERAAAIATVADVLERAQLPDAVLFAADFDSLAIEQAIRDQTASTIRNALLSPPAQALFDRVLQDACAYIVEVATSLPPFTSNALTELLRRETEAQQMLATIIERLPEARRSEVSASDDFELRYRREVARVLDRLELFGLSVSEFARRYTLSVAYISLTASIAPSSGSVGRGAPDDEEFVRVDEVLARSPRTLIRGEAGSGKTTLLQWIGVRSARGEFEGELGSWNETVPFFVPLRRYVSGSMPAPEDFVSAIVPNIAGVMPAGWVHEVLDNGRGIVLIDGVDELPEDQREDARRWLGELVATFPQARFVVTSRPPAVEKDWLERFEFSRSELQPMTPSDIGSFIRHWHDAMAEGGSSEDRQELVHLASLLITATRDKPQIRGLATSPLLCAMLCALHRDRRRQLPRDRLELYRISLETLLERRDLERALDVSEIGLSLPQKELLLRSFAYWLVVNGQTDAERSSAIACFARQLQSFPDVRHSADAVYDFLLQRSGLLREPVVGRADFVHRTFQEYLAARHIIEHDSVGMLVDHATNDEWREVIILAAGHARRAEAEELLQRLLDLGDENESLRHRVHLLAVACLETVRELSPALDARVRETLRALVPPTNMTEARALASAGELAIPMLRPFASERVHAAAACVRTLALIGTPAALDALTAFSADPRVTVTRELVRAWTYFDAAEFADRVLAESPLDRGSITVRDPALIPHIRRLKHANDVAIWMPRGLAVDLSSMTDIADRIVSLVAPASILVSVEDAPAFTRLRHANFEGSRLSSLAPLARLPLEWLSVHGCQEIVDLAPVASMPLKSLYFAETPVHTVTPLAEVETLETIDLARTGVTDVSPLADLSHLKVLRVSGNSIPGLEFRHASLQRIWADRTPIATLDGSDWRLLQRASVAGCTALQSIDGLERAGQLRHLNISWCERIESLDVLRDLAGSLASLSMPGVNQAGFDFLGTLTELEWLDLNGCDELTDGDLLRPLSKLKTLDISRTGIREFGFLRDLRNLRQLYLSYEDKDVSELNDNVLHHTQSRVSVRWYLGEGIPSTAGYAVYPLYGYPG